MPKKRKTPLRMCVGCRDMFDKRQLIRIVRTPEGSVEVDPTGRKNGRGAYVCRRPECLQRAVKSGQLQRSLKTEVPAEVLAVLQEQMEEQVKKQHHE